MLLNLIICANATCINVTEIDLFLFSEMLNCLYCCVLCYLNALVVSLVVSLQKKTQF